ncbi:glycosyltransferase family 2 protein [Porphyromonas levii]|uniref:glycosyltransferase family 2 protein n=1 Tax=Porphyromonas levii TaxID=28114 RepID=UPI001BA778A3|nr:glycosyltransferase family 2 protein [Porphyromonas levii]MBR8806253.1 hypothetical protein [Porphyromonas levii]
MKVSVIIPTYGRSDFLHKAVHSVLEQSYSEIELIIVDDNGAGTPNQRSNEQFIKDLNSAMVSYIPLPQNRGGSHARNVGAFHSSGDFICFLDDDDEFLPEKISKQVELLSKRSDFVACYTNHIRINHVTNKRYATNSRMQGDLRKALLLFQVDLCGGSTLMVRRTAFNELEGFVENLKRNQDYEFVTRLSHLGPIGVVEEPLTIINTHRGSNRLHKFSEVENNRLRYINVVEFVIRSLSEEDQKLVFDNNYMFLLIEAIKLHSLRGVLKYFSKCGFSIDIIKKLMKKTTNYIKKRL